MNYWKYEDKWYDAVSDIFPELTNNILVQVFPASLFGHNNFLSRSNNDIIVEIVEAYNKGKRVFVYECLREALILDVLTKFSNIVNSLDLKDASFIWLTGDHAGESISDIKMPNKKFQVRGAFYFEFISQKILFRYTKDYQPGYKEKRFLCFNNVIRQSRIDLLEYMLQYDLVKDAYYSFIGSSRDTLSTDDLVQVLQKYNNYTNIVNNKDILPLILSSNLSDGEHWTPGLVEDDAAIFYENSYFSVITETLFYDTFKSPPPNLGNVEAIHGTMITEKTYKPISMKHPFILLARPYTLKVLRDRGYKTFSPFIDESYDEILDDTIRLKAIADEINRLSKTNLVEFTYQIKDIVEYNHNHFWNQTVFDPRKI